MKRRIWRWARYGLAALLALLIGASILVFNPARQKAWLMPQIEPLVDRIALDYVFITPWSVELRGLAVNAQGAAVTLSTLDLGFNPLAVLWDTISISRLTLADARVDLKGLVTAPSEPSTEPFPGVLTAFDQGFALALANVAVDAQVLLPFVGTHPELVKPWLESSAEKSFTIDPDYKLTKREKRHRWLMKLEKAFGLDFSRKHFKLVA